jgi:oligosaccharide repeat unit polymerase
MTAYIVNPLSLFLGVWSAATVLYFGGVVAGAFPWPHPLTTAALLLNFGTFCLGYLTWSLFRDLPPRLAGGAPGCLANAATGPDAAYPRLTRERLVRALQILLLVGLAALGMELYRLVTLASHFHTTWSYLVTHPAVLRLRLVQFISASVLQTSATVILLSLINSIFSIGFVLVGLFLYLDRTWWKYFYVFAFLSISLAIGLMHLSRYEVTTNILYLVLAYCFLHSQNSGKFEVSSLKSPSLKLQTSNFRLLIPLFAVVVLFVAIELLLRKSAVYGHTNRLLGFAFQLYWYLASPLAAFNDFLSTFHGVYAWGQNTFFPFYKWLCRFGLAQQAEISVYGEKVFLPYLANVYTYLRNFYADFGLLGVALAPYALGWLTAAVRHRACRYVHYLNLYVVLLMLILFSFYNFFLSSNQIYLQILFGFVFFRYEMGAGCPAQPQPMFRSYQDSRT